MRNISLFPSLVLFLTCATSMAGVFSDWFLKEGAYDVERTAHVNWCHAEFPTKEECIQDKSCRWIKRWGGSCTTQEDYYLESSYAIVAGVASVAPLLTAMGPRPYRSTMALATWASFATLIAGPFVLDWSKRECQHGAFRNPNCLDAPLAVLSSVLGFTSGVIPATLYYSPRLVSYPLAMLVSGGLAKYFAWPLLNDAW
jgi:hypothetical protein